MAGYLNTLQIAASLGAIVSFIGILAAYYVVRFPRLIRIFLNTAFTLPLLFPFAMPLHGVLAAALPAFPLIYHAARIAFDGFDKNLNFAGQTLGLSNTYIFWRIRIPACKNKLLIGTALAFARVLHSQLS